MTSESDIVVPRKAVSFLCRARALYIAANCVFRKGSACCNNTGSACGNNAGSARIAYR